MRLNVLVDTGFWIALFDPGKDPENQLEAERIADEIADEVIIMPFPTLYEFVNSRLSRRESKLLFERLLIRPNVIKLNDIKYRDIALKNYFAKKAHDFTDASLVDEVLKLIILDENLSIDYLASFDTGLVNAAMAHGVRRV